jgi:recombination protein RecA
MNSAASLRASIEAQIPSAFAVYRRPEQRVIPTGISQIDSVTAGVPMSSLTEICGSGLASSGKTSVLVALLAQATRQHFCALVDAEDSFDPLSALAAGVNFSRLLWVRCGKQKSEVRSQKSEAGTQKFPGAHSSIFDYPITKLPNYQIPGAAILPSAQRKQNPRTCMHKILRPMEQAFKTADMLLQSGGFGLIVVDLSSLAERLVRKVPLTTWFRFSRVVEKQKSALVFLEQQPHATSCAGLVLNLKTRPAVWSGRLLAQFKLEAEIVRNREKKPSQSVRPDFCVRAEWM